MRISPDPHPSAGLSQHPSTHLVGEVVEQVVRLDGGLPPLLASEYKVYPQVQSLRNVRALQSASHFADEVAGVAGPGREFYIAHALTTLGGRGRANTGGGEWGARGKRGGWGGVRGVTFFFFFVVRRTRKNNCFPPLDPHPRFRATPHEVGVG